MVMMEMPLMGETEYRTESQFQCNANGANGFSFSS